MKSLFFTIILAFSTQSFANSAKIWESYFPNATCGSNCAKGVPSDALEEALGKIKYISPSTLKKAKHIFVVDFSQNSRNKRGYLINTKNGSVNRYHVSHGIGSDDGRGNAVRFSNKPDSNMSSLGLYIGAETYSGKHGHSLRLDGKEKSNSKARERAIVVHGADYARDNFIKKSGYTGRSHGCPAVDDRLSKVLIDKLKNGGALYIYN